MCVKNRVAETKKDRKRMFVDIRLKRRMDNCCILRRLEFCGLTQSATCLLRIN